MGTLLDSWPGIGPKKSITLSLALPARPKSAIDTEPPLADDARLPMFHPFHTRARRFVEICALFTATFACCGSRAGETEGPFVEQILLDFEGAWTEPGHVRAIVDRLVVAVGRELGPEGVDIEDPALLVLDLGLAHGEPVEDGKQAAPEVEVEIGRHAAHGGVGR